MEESIVQHSRHMNGFFLLCKSWNGFPNARKLAQGLFPYHRLTKADYLVLILEWGNCSEPSLVLKRETFYEDMWLTHTWLQYIVLLDYEPLERHLL